MVRESVPDEACALPESERFSGMTDSPSPPVSSVSVRAFVALPIDELLRAQLTRLQATVAATVPPKSVRWTRPEQIHLTLKFLGQVRAAAIPELTVALRSACADAPVMRLKAEGFGCFPNGVRPRVLWVGVTGDLAALVRLQERVAAATGALGAHNKREDFTAHLTLGRVQSRRSPEVREVGEALAGVAFSQVGDWRAEAVELQQSVLRPGGSVYTTLARVPLGAAG